MEQECLDETLQNRGSNTDGDWGFFEEAKRRRIGHIQQKDIEAEIKDYLAMPAIEREPCPLSLWKVYKDRFPILTLKAQGLLCIPGTAVSSERHWSASGNNVTARRESLSPELIRELVFLKTVL